MVQLHKFVLTAPVQVNHIQIKPSEQIFVYDPKRQQEQLNTVDDKATG